MINEDKTFDLMTQMYSEMQKGFKEVRQEMTDIRQEMQQGFKEVNEKIDKVEQNQVRLEDKFDTKISALFDGHSSNAEKLNSLEEKIDVMQGDINNLSIKTINNNSKILELSKDIKRVK